MRRFILGLLLVLLHLPHGQSDDSADSRLAVCISGHTGEVFQRPLTHNSLAANLVKAFGAKKTDVFAELRVDSENDKTKVQHVLTEVLKARKFRVIVDKADKVNKVQLLTQKNTENCQLEEKHVQMWEDVEGCFKHVLDAEAEESVRYDWIFRARPDIVWYGATAPLEKFDRMMVSTASQMDHFFLTPRHLADTAFAGVMQRYRQCMSGNVALGTQSGLQGILGEALMAKGIRHRMDIDNFHGIVAYRNAEHPHAKQRCSEVETPIFKKELCMRMLYGDRPESNMDFMKDQECSTTVKKNLDHIAGKKVLILTPLKDAEDKLERYAATLKSLTYPKELISVGLLVSDTSDNTYQVAQHIGESFLSEFDTVEVFRKDFHYEAPQDRHSFEVQAERRKILAQSRNELLRMALKDDTFAVLWLDVDITGLPSTIIQDLLSVGKPVVAPHVRINDITYDRNSWRENHPEVFMLKEGPEVVFEGYDETKSAGGMRDYLDDLQAMAEASGLQDPLYAVPIDGVGTAVLFVEAKVHRHKEIFFPEVPYKKRLESEGFGLKAKDSGFAVCGLPNYFVQHFDEWSPERSLQTRANVSATSKISVNMTLNIDYDLLSAADKDTLQTKLQETFAEAAGVDPAAVSVKLTKGSVKVTVEIQAADAIAAKSIETSISEGKPYLESQVVEAATAIPGVKAAAIGDLKVEGFEVDTITEETTDKEIKPPKKPPAKGPRVCEDWCKGHKSGWKDKCGFKKCNGCPPCGEDGKVLKGECGGPAACTGKKKKEVCDRMRKQEGKCKWEYIKDDGDAPGECIGKRYEAECDDKDKNTCRQLAREGKCKWLLSPKNRKTPTGDCLGQAECIGKSRRICHRFRAQEGKCKWKPAPENEVTLETKVDGVNCETMSSEERKKFEKGLKKTIAEKATGGDETAVVVETECGSIKVKATLDLEERIGIMEAEKEGQDIDLVKEMEAVKGEVQKDLEKEDVKKGILKEVATIEGVNMDDITITDTKTGTNAAAATKAPSVEPSPAPSPGTDDPSPAPSPESGVSTTSAPSAEDDASEGASDPDQQVVSAAIYHNVFASALVGTIVLL